MTFPAPKILDRAPQFIWADYHGSIALDRRRKNNSWMVADEHDQIQSWDQAQLAVLLDLRDDLQEAVTLLRGMQRPAPYINPTAYKRKRKKKIKKAKR